MHFFVPDQITKNCLGQSEHENDTQGRCEKRIDRRTRLEENVS